MQTQEFSVKSVLKEGWHLVRGTKLAIICTMIPMLIAAIVMVVILGFVSMHTRADSVASLIQTFLNPLIQAIFVSGFGVGIMMLGVRRARQESVKAFDGLKYFRFLPRLAIIGYLESLFLLVVMGTMMIGLTYLLMKLGITDKPRILSSITLVTLIVSLTIETFLIFSYVLCVDKKLSILGSIFGSIRLVKAHFFKLILLSIAVILINFLGVLLLGVGLIWTIPLSITSFGVAYNQLADKGV